MGPRGVASPEEEVSEVRVWISVGPLGRGETSPVSTWTKGGGMRDLGIVSVLLCEEMPSSLGGPGEEESAGPTPP